MTVKHTIESEFQSLIDQLSQHRDQSVVRSALVRLSNACGFQTFAYVCSGGTEASIMSNYPLEWQGLYAENNLNRIDPVVRLARRQMRPVQWSRNDPAFATAEHQRFFDQAAAHGVSSGLTIPVPAAYGRLAMLTLASSDAERAQDVELGNPVNAVAAAAFVHVYIARSRTQSSPVKGPDLTAQQLACLSWTSFGKTMTETGMLLGISSNTVRFHLKEVKERLEAVSLAHAVRLAIKQRLI